MRAWYGKILDSLFRRNRLPYAMSDIDLRQLPDGEFVLHFGGRPNEVDAFTFSSSLIAISEAIQEINRQVNPDYSIEISIDGLGTGSFRAKLKTASKSLAGLFKHRFTEQILIGILVAFICQKIWPADQVKIIINDDSYVVQHGSDRIILPKACREAQQRITDRKAVEKHIAKTFQVLQEDSSVTDFGFARNIGDEIPFAIIPQSDFARLSRPEDEEEDDTRTD